MSKNYTLDDILKEYDKKEDKPTVRKPASPPPVSSGNIQNTGYINISKAVSGKGQTIAYSLDDIEEINAPEKKPAPSHASSKFQVTDVSRPNVSYINSVKEVVKNPADLPPRPTDQIKDYDGAVLTKPYSNDEYAPKVRKMSNSTRAKEMRGKRKKKKQPEFTYERESPDGVYTKPQKRHKKFIVSHDSEKITEKDKMAAVDLSTNADPEMLDIKLEATHEPVEKIEKKPKEPKDHAIIKDYDSYENPKEIKRSIFELESSFSFRFLILSILFIFSAFISAGNSIGIPVPEILTPKNPEFYSGVQLIVVILSMMISIDTVKSGIIKLFKFKADTDSLAAFASFAAAAAAIACIINPGQLSAGNIHIYTPIAILSMVFNSIGKRLILKRAEMNFDFTAKEKNKYAVFCVEDEIRSESFTRGTIGDFPILAGMKKTNFFKDFSKYTFSVDGADKLCRPFVPFIIIMSALASIAITLVKTRNLDKNALSFALSIFTLYISASSCAALPLIANIPLGKAAKKYSRNHGIMLGYQSVEDFYDTNSIMVDAGKLFPTGSITLSSIKLFSDTKIDDAILNAASLTEHADSVLKDLFGDVVAGKVMILKRVENYVYEDSMGICGWIDNKRVLLGNRELMQSHNIEGIPTKTKETEFTEGGKDAVYLSVSGNLSAMFIIEISATAAVKTAMKRLEKNDMAVVVKAIDPFITINRISTIFNFTEDLLKIVPTRMLTDYDAETAKTKKVSTSLACSGKFNSFVNLLMSAKSIKKTVSLGIVLQSVSAILGMGIVTLNCIMNTFTDLSPAWMLGYNLICIAVTSIIIGVRKI
ncbi:MAG: hypothetical protein NC320_11390 [Clostridium sp.]|nr:hypothetical protein [Clostridium sp.]MCM1548194.1 hypothetical protein [Ruminococcus sp.]